VFTNRLVDVRVQTSVVVVGMVEVMLVTKWSDQPEFSDSQTVNSHYSQYIIKPVSEHQLSNMLSR
jgi:hypothetical protein